MSERLSDHFCECGCGQRTPFARRTRGAQGIKKGEPLRFVDRHQGIAGGRPRVEKRWELRDMGFETPCWVWLLAKTSDGYGSTGVADTARTLPAHRAVWIETNGPLPEETLLHHRCEVKACVNPDHLQPMKRAEHTRLHEPEKAAI